MSFPQTLQDAIIITRKLEIPYLWIDAICIKQDSEDDWAREASKMRDVYRGAFVTIAAACASKSSSGIFKERPIRESYCWIRWQDGGIAPHNVFLRPGTELADTTLRSSPINTRGWTIQETLLAPRTLFFGAEQMLFECVEGQIDEAGRSTPATESYRSKAFMHELAQNKPYVMFYKLMRFLRIPPVVHIYLPRLTSGNLPFKRTLRSLAIHYSRHERFYTQGLLALPGGLFITFYDLWRDIVNRYSSRQLSKDDDVLPALSGLADEFNQVTGDHYFAGIWKDDLIRSLTWSRGALRKKRRNGSVEHVQPLTTYLAPSWSWASVTGKSIIFQGAMPDQSSWRIIRSAKVVDVSTEPSTLDQFGKLRSGSLTLRGPFAFVDNPQNPPRFAIGMVEFQKQIRSALRSQITPQGHEFRQKHQEYTGQQFGLLEICTMKQTGVQFPITEVHFFLLESDPKGSWRRVAGFSQRRDPVFAGELDETMLREFATMSFRRKITIV
ncbi:MAG: hypothetical protein Q9165_008040 [Trypethelium subeluteriae]